MKKLLQSVLSITTAVFLTACSVGSNNDDISSTDSIKQLNHVTEILNEDEIGGEISISAYDTLRYGRYLEEAAKAFEEKYPGTKVNINTFSVMPEARTINGEDGRAARVITNERDETAEMDYINKVNVEFMSGGGHDILAVDLIPYYKYADRGIIENLSLYMSEDKDFNEHDYAQNILKAAGYKGGQYIFPMDYSFDFLSYDKRYVSNEAQQYFIDNNKFDFDDLFEMGSSALNELNAEDVKLFNLYGGIGASPSLFSRLLDINYSRFVDIENKEVNFNAESFVNMLKSINEYETDGYLLEQISNNNETDIERIFINNNADCLYKFNNSMLLFMLYAPDTGRNIMISGSGVNKENDEIAGVVSNRDGEVNFEYSQAYAINSNSKNKRTAWEFLKFLASEEMQVSLALRGFPVNTNARAEKAKLSITGNIFMLDDETDMFTELTEEQQNSYENYMNAISNFTNELNSSAIKDPVITSMIEVEVKNYFNGNKTAEEAAASLQSRVDLYLNE